MEVPDARPTKSVPEFRSAGMADAEAISALVNAAFRPERFYADEDRTNPDQIRALFETGKFLLAEDEGSLIGCVCVEPRGARAYIGLLAVHPHRQRSGLGNRLMAAAENECRAFGCSDADLTFVNLRTELPEFYRSLGYVEDGTAPFPMHSNLPCHLIKMTKPLS